MPRSIKGCINCGETREMAAHGLCFKCYRAEERELSDARWARPDPSAKELAKTQRKTRKALMKMLDALEEIEVGKLVPEATTEAWRTLLRPEVEKIALSLGQPKVNSEQENESDLFTQDRENEALALGEAKTNGEPENINEPFTESADESSQQVNCEQQNVSEQFTDLADPVNSEQEKVSELFTEPTSQGSEQVNSEDTPASEPVQTDSYRLPPVIEQYRKKIKESKSKTDGRAEGHATRI